MRAARSGAGWSDPPPHAFRAHLVARKVPAARRYSRPCRDLSQRATDAPYDGRLYIPEERGGLLSCYDVRTGKPVYKERLPGARGFTTSPWAYEGNVSCLDNV